MATPTLASPAASHFGFSPAFLRLMWKEYRSLRAVWVVLLFIAAIWRFMLSILSPPFEAQLMTFSLPAMFAMGAGVLLFAWESEDRTLNLLRIYPIPPGRLFLAKLCLGFLGMILLALFVGLLILVTLWSPMNDPFLSGRPLPLVFAEWQFWMLAAVSIFGWSIFFSLLTGRVLPTLLIAPVALLMTVRLPYQPVLIAVLYIADWRLARRWLLDKPLPVPRLVILKRTRALPRRVLFVSESASPWKVAFARLLWLEWQNARLFVWLAFGVGLVAMTVGLFVFNESSLGFSVSSAYLLVLPAWMGAWSFAGEQHQRRFRVPTQRGLAPSMVWLSKQVVWLPLTFLLCGLLLWFDTYLHLWTRSIWKDFPPGRSVWMHAASGFSQMREGFGAWETDYVYRAIAGTSLWIGLSYTSGQFLSMNLSRAITATVVTLPMLGLIVLWWWLIGSFGIPIIFTVVPIPFVLLGATWLQSRDWLLERTGWKRWLKLASLIGVPMLAVLVGVIVFRVTEIPKVVVPALSSLQAPTAAELQNRRGPMVIGRRMDTVSQFNPAQWRYIDPAQVRPRNTFHTDGLYIMAGLLRGLSPPPKSFSTSTIGQAGDAFSAVDAFSTERQVDVASRKPLAFDAAISSRVLLLCDGMLQPVRRVVRNVFDQLSTRRNEQFDENMRLVELRIETELELEFILNRIKSADVANRPMGLDDASKLQVLFKKRGQQAEEKTQAGQLNEALAHHLARFQMCRRVAQAGEIDAWWWAKKMEEESFGSLQKWLVHPRQTSDRIRIAMIRVQEELAQWPPLENWVVKKHLSERANFETDWSLSAHELRGKYGQAANYVEGMLWLRRCLPWEKSRVLRLYDATSLAAWNDVVEFRAFLSDGRYDIGAWLFDRAHGETRARIREVGGAPISSTVELDRLLGNVDPKPWSWSATTMNPYGGWTNPLISYDRHLRQLQDFGTHEARRRGWMIVMALVAWRLEHGKLPKRLDELAPSYFGIVPTDPWTGRNFGYRPEGFPLPAEFGASHVEPNKPVIWSVGPDGSDPIRSLSGTNGDAAALIFTLGPRLSTYSPPSRNRFFNMSVPLAHVIPN